MLHIHRVIQRGPYKVTWYKCRQKTGSPLNSGGVAQGFVLSGHENFQGKRLCSLSWQPDSTNSENVFMCVIAVLNVMTTRE